MENVSTDNKTSTPGLLSHQTYLGDGVYAGFDGIQIAIWTYDGYSTTNVVYLNEEVLDALWKMIERINKEMQ